MSPLQPDPASSAPAGRTRARLLAIVATGGIIALLKWSAPVTMPIAVGVFLAALAWPIERRLDRHVPRLLAYLAALAALALAGAILGAALVWSVELVAEAGARHGGEITGALESVRRWARERGVPLPEDGGLSSFGTRAAERAVRSGLSTLSALVLIAAFAALALDEIRDFRLKIQRAFSGPGSRNTLDALERIGEQFVSYLGAVTVQAAITGVLVGLFCWAVGLELAFVWGLLAFLLNYVPTIGSIVGVVPPALYALIQYDGLGMVALVLGGITAIEVVMGSFIGPRIEGRYLSMSPFVVLAAITLWGWIWGIPGALLGVPITVALVVATREFESTRWIAVLLADVEDEDDAEVEDEEDDRG